MRETRPDIPARIDDDDALDDRLVRHLDGRLDADAFAALNDRLAVDTEAVDRLLAYSAQHAILGERAEHDAASALIARVRVEQIVADRHDRRERRMRQTFAAGLAAALIAVVGWWAMRTTSLESPPQPAPGVVTDRTPAPDPSDTDAVGPPGRIDLTREIFAGPIDGPPPTNLMGASAADSAPDRPWVAMASTPIRLTLAWSHEAAEAAIDWPILGGTLESFPRLPAHMSPGGELNPILQFTP